MKYWHRLFAILFFLFLPAFSTQASEEKPTSAAGSRIEEGLEMLDRGQSREAMEIFDSLSKAYPADPAPAYYLGVAAVRSGQDVTAVDAFIRCASLDPTFEWVQANLGLTLFRLDEIDLAEDHLLEALLQGPENADVLLHLGMIDAQRAEYDRALRLYQQSADVDPETAGLAMLASAYVEIDRGDLLAALDFLERTQNAPGPSSAKKAAVTMISALMTGSTAPPRFIIQGNAGFELDDNVTVAEEDLATGLSDEALVLGVGAEYRLLNEETAWIILGYNFYQSLYRTLTDFDLRIQEPRLTIGGRVGRVYPTLSYAYQNQTLGSNGFLSSHLIDFNTDIALTERWSLFVGAEAERITYDATPARTGYRGAINLGPEVRLFDDLLSFNLIWEPSWQRTEGAAFNYNGQSLLTELNGFIPLGRGLDIGASYQYIHNDYTDEISGFGLGRRKDRFHVLRLGLQMPLAKYANLSADYLHLRSHSTIPDLNYSQNILTFRLGFWYF